MDKGARQTSGCQIGTSHTASLIPQFVLIGKRHKLQSPEAIKLKMLPLPRLAMARKRLQQWRRLIELLSTSHRGILSSGHRTVEQTSIGIAMQWAIYTIKSSGNKFYNSCRVILKLVLEYGSSYEQSASSWEHVRQCGAHGEVQRAKHLLIAIWR
jgi:hypothetical protein